MTRPYPVMRQVKAQYLHGTPQQILVEYELADTPNISAQTERLIAQTLVPLPLPPDQKSVELAALIRVRDLLDKQIAEIRQSP
jgi:hypothetical protein